MNANEYIPIILDIGCRFIRAGIAGESRPSIVVSTALDSPVVPETTFPSFVGMADHALTPFQQDQLHHKLLENADYVQLGELFAREKNRWLNLEDEVKLTMKLYEVFTSFAISTRNCKVVVIDREYSNLFKVKLLKILLRNLTIKSVIFQSRAILSIVGANISHGLVIDFAWESASINSVVDLRVLDTYELPSNYAGLSLHYQIALKLIQLKWPLGENVDLFDTIEKGIENTHIGDVSESVGETSEINSLPAELLHTVIEEVYFTDSYLVDKIETIISQTDIDNRRLLLQNIVITGWVSRIPGFKTKLIELIQQRVDTKGTFTLGSWCGCSLYVATKLINDEEQWKTRQFTRENLNQLVENGAYKLAAMRD